MQTQGQQRNLRQRSASADTIDRTATIHRSSGGHRTRDRPRHQPDAGSYDATGRITYVLAAALACSMLAAMNPVNSSADNAIENFIFGLLSNRRIRRSLLWASADAIAPATKQVHVEISVRCEFYGRRFRLGRRFMGSSQPGRRHIHGTAPRRATSV
jgi:hypothetical protein